MKIVEWPRRLLGGYCVAQVKTCRVLIKGAWLDRTRREEGPGVLIVLGLFDDIDASGGDCSTMRLRRSSPPI